MSTYRRVTYEDRCQIYALSKSGTSQKSIASVLAVSQSTVSRELRRNRGQRGYGSSKQKRRLKRGRRYDVSPAS